MKILLLFLVFLSPCVQSIDQLTEDEVKEIVIDGATVVIGEVPVIGTIVKIFAPAAKKLIGIGSDNKDEAQLTAIKSIQNELRETRSKLQQSLARIEIAVELDIVREIENNAGMLMQYLEDVANANALSKNKTVATFLEKCAKNDPYDNVLKLNDQIKKTLRMTLQKDVFHSKTNLNVMKRKLMAILHELTIVEVFKLYFTEGQSEEDLAATIQIWEQKLAAIANTIRSLYEELLDSEYWSKLGDFVEAAMIGNADSSANEKAERVAKYLFDMHTNDRFCVVARKRKEGPTHVHVYAADENLFHENEHYFVKIVRSNSAHKMAANGLAEFEKSVQTMQNEFSSANGKQCPFSGGHELQAYRDVVLHNSMSAIVTEPRAGRQNMELPVVKCDGGISITIPTNYCEIPRFMSNAVYSVQAVPK